MIILSKAYFCIKKGNIIEKDMYILNIKTKPWTENQMHFINILEKINYENFNLDITFWRQMASAASLLLAMFWCVPLLT